MSQRDADNRSNQMNPNNDAYWQSRGYDERPEDWEEDDDNEDDATIKIQRLPLLGSRIMDRFRSGITKP